MKVTELPSLKSNKILLIGNSGAGKTGACLELAKAGYTLRIADFDDKAGDLAVKSGILDAEAQARVDVIPCRVAKTSQAGAYRIFKKALVDWEGQGGLADWDSNTILIVDSLTYMSQAIFDNAELMNPGVIDRRQLYHAAQTELHRRLSSITASAVRASVIVTAHIQYIDIFAKQKELPARTEGYPKTSGRALSPYIGTYFNSLLEVDIESNAKRIIRTKPSRFIKTKIPVLAKKGLKDKYPVAGGLVEIFKLLKA